VTDTAPHAIRGPGLLENAVADQMAAQWDTEIASCAQRLGVDPMQCNDLAAHAVVKPFGPDRKGSSWVLACLAVTLLLARHETLSGIFLLDALAGIETGVALNEYQALGSEGFARRGVILAEFSEIGGRVLRDEGLVDDFPKLLALA
jgi:hypothetical protein